MPSENNEVEDFIVNNFTSSDQSDASKLYPLMQAANSKSYLIVLIVGVVLIIATKIFGYNIATFVVAIISMPLGGLLLKKRNKAISKYNQTVDGKQDHWIPIIDKLNEFIKGR